MKVVVDCRYVRAVPTGIGAVVAEVALRLPDAAPEIDFVFLTHRERPTLLDRPNVTHLVPPFVADGPGTIFALGPWVRRRVAYDVFHATFGLMPFFLGARTVVTVHDTMWLSSPGMVRSPGPWGRAERHFYGPGTARALAHADALLVPSEATKADVLRLEPHAPPIVVTPWGLPALSPEGSDAALARHGLAKDGYVLTVGRAAGYKNQETVVEAFAKAFPRGSSEKLALVQRRAGTGEALYALAEQRGVADRVVFLPAVSDAELAGLYAGALCLCHPSFVEGFGLPIVEAMARGCPVVTSDRSAMPEAAGGAAALVDPSDPDSVATALRAMRDPDVRETHRAKGRARAEAATWDLAVARTVGAYRG